MARWTCPECHREFGRRNQGHECAPAMSLDDYFSTGPPHERPIFDAVWAHLSTLEDVHVEPVSVGIFFKRTRTFAELRPKDRWSSLSFSLHRTVRHPTITRKVNEWSGRYYHVANIRSPDDVDDDIRDWLTESWSDG
jgi:Domain of unknown function (DUF5655)